MSKIAVLGLGQMGAPIATRLVHAGNHAMGEHRIPTLSRKPVSPAGSPALISVHPTTFPT
jgi:3-hydroxyisobutyrate dehydrogenase-like beta-hydroxyacid dehydrogenase